MTAKQLFANTVPVKDFASFRQRAINLYREWLREIPRAITKYPLDITLGEGRARVRQEFEKHARYWRSSFPPDSDEEKLAAMNVALLKGTQELIEVHNRWSQKTHVMRWFDGAWETENPIYLAAQRLEQLQSINSKQFSPPQPSSFLKKFYFNK